MADYTEFAERVDRRHNGVRQTRSAKAPAVSSSTTIQSDAEPVPTGPIKADPFGAQEQALFRSHGARLRRSHSVGPERSTVPPPVRAGID